MRHMGHRIGVWSGPARSCEQDSHSVCPHRVTTGINLAELKSLKQTRQADASQKSVISCSCLWWCALRKGCVITPTDFFYSHFLFMTSRPKSIRISSKYAELHSFRIFENSHVSKSGQTESRIPFLVKRKIYVNCQYGRMKKV